MYSGRGIDFVLNKLPAKAKTGAWYHGLALGGIARVSQTKLFQLFITLAVSAWLLRETIRRLDFDLWHGGRRRNCDRRPRPDRPIRRVKRSHVM